MGKEEEEGEWKGGRRKAYMSWDCIYSTNNGYTT